MQGRISPRNPNPNKTKMALHFLRALSRIKRGKTSSHCGWRIKHAAYASMAAAGGPKRIWSSAVVRRLRRRAEARFRRTRRRDNGTARKLVQLKAPLEAERDQVEELRRLVPGGRRMDDFCCLLEETGDYIKCLTAQVQLMQKIDDYMFKQLTQIRGKEEQERISQNKNAVPVVLKMEEEPMAGEGRNCI